ncbi:MAG: hypothetical protein J3K34DRAFT_477206, partial [Monoraphidium minutum]
VNAQPRHLRSLRTRCARCGDRGGTYSHYVASAELPLIILSAMDTDLRTAWAAVASAPDLSALKTAWAAFIEPLDDAETLEEEAPLIVETVLVGRPLGLLDVLTASFRADAKEGGDFRARALDFLQQLLRALGPGRLAPEAGGAAAAAAERCAQLGWHEGRGAGRRVSAARVAAGRAASARLPALRPRPPGAGARGEVGPCTAHVPGLGAGGCRPFQLLFLFGIDSKSFIGGRAS